MTTPSFIREARSRVEAETKKLVDALLHDNYAIKKFELETISDHDFTGIAEQYGKLSPQDLTKIDPKLTELIKLLKFPSDNIYAIHICKKTQIYYGGSTPSIEVHIVDNYGNIHAFGSYMLHPESKHTPTSLSLDHYQYPLSKKSIDMIKKLPTSVESATSGDHNGFNARPGGCLKTALSPVVAIKTLSASIYQRHLLIEKYESEKKSAETAFTELLIKSTALEKDNKKLEDETISLRKASETANADNERLRLENQALSNEIHLLRLGLDTSLFSTHVTNNEQTSS
jgi:hypothetical protein